MQHRIKDLVEELRSRSVIRALIAYSVTDACTGCTICVQRCPADAIPFTPYRKHEIDTDLCTRCDVCRGACPEDAIEVR